MKATSGIIFIAFILLAFNASSQKYLTKNGTIKFVSDAPLEKNEAVNRQVNSALNTGTGDFVFKVLMKSFEFQKALMQEHFNENYVESDKYPNSTFSGKVTNLKEVNFTKDGKYNVTVEGNLTIHGETKPVKAGGTLEVKGDKILAASKFNINLDDYKIKIPNAVVGKLNKTIQITVDVTLDKLNK